mmetsp:Transcript_15734/g.46946  ORF Transcript_15734/g.46946 Transcript_15734/m.46946 type:complete len:192 (-) Transcript_15734:22-597(-)
MLRAVAEVARARPFAFGALTCTVKTATCDVMIQTCVEKKEEIDPTRVAVFTTFGFLFLGCWQFSLYNILFPRMFPSVEGFLTMPLRERLRDGRGLRCVGYQVLIENFGNNVCLYFPCFYSVQAWYEGRDAAYGLRKFQSNFRDDAAEILEFWVPVQTCNFFLSPLWMRVPITSAASLLWTSHVSFSRGDDK